MRILDWFKRRPRKEPVAYEDIVIAGYIHDAIRAAKGKPIGLPWILWSVEARSEIPVSYKKLVRGFKRLVESGQIAEAPGPMYTDTANAPKPSQFPGLSIEDYQKAGEKYRNQQSMEEFAERNGQQWPKPPSPDDLQYLG